MKKFQYTLAAMFLIGATASHAGILDFKQIHIDLTSATDTVAKATWSDPTNITVSTKGLGWDGEPASSRDGWIQTKPLALGLSWRTPCAVSVRVTIEPPPQPITLNNGQKTTPGTGAVYVRYSPDLKHWSSWQVLQQTEPPSRNESRLPVRHFRGMIQVPQSEREEYNRLLSEYARRDVPWKSDEDAAVRWILEQQPDFFAKYLPFIGYVQFQYECGFHGNQRLQSFKGEIHYGMGGMHAIPKDPNVYKDRDSPWSFRADDKMSAPETAPAK